MNIQISHSTDWKVISIIQLAFFILLMISFVLITLVQIRKGISLTSIRGFFIFLIVFQLAKIVGGITGIILLDSSNFNQNVFIATYICDSISYGFITRGVSSLIQHMLNTKDQDSHQRTSNVSVSTFDMENQKFESTESEYKIDEKQVKKKSPFTIVTLILLAAVICNIVGMSNLSGSTAPDNTTETLIKTSAVLFLVGMILLILASIYLIIVSPNNKPTCTLLIVILLILIIRCIYSLLSAFHGVNFNQPSQYMLIFGDSKYYGFLALLPEGVAGILIMVVFFQW
ncbi:hypothetical protein KGF54_004776 [Candida jiufengensis]|uniref:uncharacterized protein n=1 Tax=Candida jiufengensis TaxID=497108 RepID=UPI0022247F63|nr:uncharacterized protein KGF54_004776 [Candida jiufengensis]KAI5951701.1 hypothetical protein KGF54_004776 [Candida jiufengensis]